MSARCDECGQFTALTYGVWGSTHESGIDHDACRDCLCRNPRPVFGVAPGFLRDRLSYECERSTHNECHGFHDGDRHSLYSGYDTYACQCGCHQGGA